MKKTAVLILLSLITAILLILLARWGITATNNRQINGALSSDLPPQTVTTGDFALTWDGETLFATHTSQPDKLLWQTVPDVSFVNAARGIEYFVFPKDIKAALRANEQAWGNFQKYSGSYQRIRIAYVDTARKRPEEFEKRLANLIKKTEQNKQFGFGIESYY